MKQKSLGVERTRLSPIRVKLVGRNWLFRSLMEERLSRLDGVVLRLLISVVEKVPRTRDWGRFDILLVAAEDLDNSLVRRLSGQFARFGTRVYAVSCHDITKTAAQTRRPPIEGIITPWMSDELISLILRSHNGSTGKVNGLSQREKMVVEHLQSGMTMKAVASLLGCSIPAVQSYKQRAMLKLGAQNSNELAVRWRSAVGTSVREE